MRVLITGATGFIGKPLCKALALKGHELIVVTRDSEKARREIPAPHLAMDWEFLKVHQSNPISKLSSPFSSIDAVIHLAGESLVGKRWSPTFKQKLYESRIQSTQKLCEWLQKTSSSKPKVFISTSAIGIYGDRLNEVLDESSLLGTGFLAHLCQDWEKALFESDLPETRKIVLRMGVVLGKGGGVLEKMVPSFSLGFGAALGSGKQWVSWIHLDDCVGLILECLENQALSGPVLACAPKPVTQMVLSRTLAQKFHSFGFFRVPKSCLRVALGEVSQVLVSSQRGFSSKLKKTQFHFQYPDLDSALDQILGQSVALGYSEFISQCWTPQPLDEVFRFFSEARNLEKMTPPWLNFKILFQSTPKIEKGTKIHYRIKIHGISVHWYTEIREWSPPYSFVDIQSKGPYQVWEHTHRFSNLKGGTLIEDQVFYKIPMAWLGRVIAGPFVRKDIAKIFSYRSDQIIKGLV